MHTNLFKTLFQEGSNKLYIQLFRYLIVGGVSFLVDFGILYFLTEFLTIPYLISAAFGFCGGLVTNYFLSIHWVFNSDVTNKKIGSELLGWALVGLIGLGLNTLLMWLFTSILLFYYLISKIISTIIVFGWNFIARKFLVTKINFYATVQSE